MSLRTSSALAAIALLAACGAAESPPSPGDAIECAIGEGAEFGSVCKLERVAGTKEFILHHPDGGFRRITFDPATGTLAPLDGAEPIVLEKGEGVIQFAIGPDRYRLTPEPQNPMAPTPSP